MLKNPALAGFVFLEGETRKNGFFFGADEKVLSKKRLIIKNDLREGQNGSTIPVLSGAEITYRKHTLSKEGPNFALNFTVSVAKAESDYCGMNARISMTHLHVDRTGKFALKEYYKIHGEVWESTEIGRYVVKKDTMFLFSQKRVSKDSVVEYEQPTRYFGYHEGQEILFWQRAIHSPKKMFKETGAAIKR